MEIIFDDNDNTITLDGLRTVDDAYVNDATVTLTTIRDTDGNAVSGVSFPQTMSYVSGSDGKYRYSVDKLLAVTPGNKYEAVVDAVSSGRDGHWEIPLLCKKRAS